MEREEEVGHEGESIGNAKIELNGCAVEE